VTPDEIKEVCTFWRKAQFERLGSAERTAKKQVVPAKQHIFRSLFSGSASPHSFFERLWTTASLPTQSGCICGEIERECGGLTLNESRSIDSNSFGTPS
jgi:hypothetical protein